MAKKADPDTATLLKAELKRRGMDDREIDGLLKKKRRRRTLEFDLVKAKHRMEDPRQGVKVPRVTRREPHGAPSGELVTVDEAAAELKLHPRSVQRIIREGRLPAKRIGKAYRIRRADLAAFAGLPETPAPPRAAAASMTGIVDVSGLEPGAAKLWSRDLESAAARFKTWGGCRADLIYDPDRQAAKVIVVGPPDEVMSILARVRVWMDQLEG